jgi:hypothetical protein
MAQAQVLKLQCSESLDFDESDADSDPLPSPPYLKKIRVEVLDERPHQYPLVDLTEHLLRKICRPSFLAIVKRQGFLHLDTFHMPGNGSNPPNLCYWQWVPVFVLLRGIPDKQCHFHPEWLWGGYTVIQRLNQSVRAFDPLLKINLIFIQQHQQIILYAYYDHSPAWINFRQKLQNCLWVSPARK